MPLSRHVKFAHNLIKHIIYCRAAEKKRLTHAGSMLNPIWLAAFRSCALSQMPLLRPLCPMSYDPVAKGGLGASYDDVPFPKQGGQSLHNVPDQGRQCAVHIVYPDHGVPDLFEGLPTVPSAQRCIQYIDPCCLNDPVDSTTDERGTAPGDWCSCPP